MFSPYSLLLSFLAVVPVATAVPLYDLYSVSNTPPIDTKSPPGKSTEDVRRPHLGRVPYGVVLSECKNPGQVALTFDDGPGEYTMDLLDILEDNDVKATFFIKGGGDGTGEIHKSWRKAIRRIHADGHHICNHGWSHQNMNQLSSEERTEEVVYNEMALVDILDFFPTYFRPPYGECDEDCLDDLSNLGYHVVMWNLDTQDWKHDYDYAHNYYTSTINDRSDSSSWVVLSHDIEYETVHSLAQYMIDKAKEQGYELVTLGQCFGDRKKNWYRHPRSYANNGTFV